MFRFTKNHHQALSKNTQIHYIKFVKKRFGIPNVHNKLLIMVHIDIRGTYHNQKFIVKVWDPKTRFNNFM